MSAKQNDGPANLTEVIARVRSGNYSFFVNDKRRYSVDMDDALVLCSAAEECARLREELHKFQGYNPEQIVRIIEEGRAKALRAETAERERDSLQSTLEQLEEVNLRYMRERDEAREQMDRWRGTADQLMVDSMAESSRLERERDKALATAQRALTERSYAEERYKQLLRDLCPHGGVEGAKTLLERLDEARAEVERLKARLERFGAIPFPDDARRATSPAPAPQPVGESSPSPSKEK